MSFIYFVYNLIIAWIAVWLMESQALHRTYRKSISKLINQAMYYFLPDMAMLHLFVNFYYPCVQIVVIFYIRPAFLAQISKKFKMMFHISLEKLT